MPINRNIGRVTSLNIFAELVNKYLNGSSPITICSLKDILKRRADEGDDEAKRCLITFELASNFKSRKIWSPNVNS